MQRPSNDPRFSDPDALDQQFSSTGRVPIRRIMVTLLWAWVFTIGACTGFVAYLFSTRLLLTKTGMYSSAPAGRLLLISSISSRAASIITPFVTTLVAFKLSAEWLQSESFDGRVDKGEDFRVGEDQGEDPASGPGQTPPPPRTIQPSATQFSNIVNLCSTASPNSVLSAVRHLYTSPATSGNAFLLVMAVRTLVPLLAVGYALAVVEGIWLHAATLPTLLPLNTTLPSSQNRQLSRTIDNFCKQNPVYSDCDGEQILACSLKYQANSCSDAQGAIDILRGSNEAVLTANNVSTTNVVKYTSDAFSPYPPSSTLSSTRALLLPYMSDDVQAKLSYIATTTGIRTTCDNITPNCNVQVTQPNDSPEAGSVLYSDCPDKPGLTQSVDETNTALGPQASWNISEFDPTGTNTLPRGQKANPFPLALAMIFNVDLGDVSNSTTPQLLGGMMHTRGPRLFGLLWCQVEVLSPVTYRNDRGNLQVLEEKLANEGSAEVWAVSGAFNVGLVAKIYADGQASPLAPEANRSISLTSGYSQSLARVVLSIVAGIHDRTPSIQETDVRIVQASHVPWAPLALFIVLVLIYAVLVGWACWNVWWATWRVKVVTAMDGASSSSEPLCVIASKFSDPGTVVFDMIASHRGTSESVTEQETLGEVKLKLGKRRDGAFGLLV